MVAGKIGETTGGETHSIDTAEFQGVAGHLHHRGVHAPLGHHRQKRLQCRSLRSGQRAGHIRTGDSYTDGTDQPHGPARRAQARLDQVAGGRLSRGAGHPEYNDPVRRVSVYVRRQCPQHRTRFRMHQHRHRWPLAEQSMDDRDTRGIGEDGHRPGRQGRAGELGPVRAGAGQCGEEVSRHGILGPQGDAGDPNGRHIATVGRNGANLRGQGGQRQTRCAPRPKCAGHAGHLRRLSLPDRLFTLPISAASET